jgi:hypothetical protein
MAQRRRRHVRRDATVLLCSLVAHMLFFYFAGRELFKPYPMPQETEPAVQVELVPEVVPPIPPLPPPKPVVTPKPQPVTKPTPQPQPKPQPQPVVPIPLQLNTKAPIKPTAPAKLAHLPTLAPVEKPSTLSTLPTAPIEAPPGPPKAVSRNTVVSSQPARVAAPNLNLHKPKQSATELAPAASIPGAFTAPPQPGAQAAGGGAPGGPTAGPLRSGGMPPGFGSGLGNSLLGCINPTVAHLTPEQIARCNARMGANAAVAPGMSPIGAARRGELDEEAATQHAEDQYRDSTPAPGTEPSPENPHVGALIDKAVNGGQ